MGSLAWTGSSTIATMFGGSDLQNLLFWWQAAGTTQWNPETVSAGDYSQYGWPAIAATSTGAVIAAVDGGGNLNFWWQTAGTKPWHQQSVASGLFAGQPAAIAWTGTGVVIAALDTSNNVLFWWQTAGTTQWHPQTVALAGVQTEPNQPAPNYVTPVAIAATDSFVGITAPDSNGNLNYWQQALGTTPWNHTVVLGTSYSNSDIASTGSSIVITAVDDSGNLYYWGQDVFGYLDGGLVQAQQGNVVSRQPKIAWANGSPVILCVNSLGHLDCWRLPSNPTSQYWNKQVVATAGGQGGYTFPAIASTGKAVIVTAINTSSGNLDFWSEPAGSGNWPKEVVGSLG
jgi:hypothetical protein